MESRRNILFQPTQPSKSSNLMQPLLTISKASTPVRTRVVVAHSPLNSTPIMTNKIKPTISRSPLNKENIQNNHYKQLGNTKNYTLPSETEQRINLSPVLALNKKLNQGPKPAQKKSLTPQTVKIDDYQEGSYNTTGRYQTLTDSNGNGNFNQTANLSGIRNSSSFKELIEVRANTPNRFSSGSSPFKKRQSVPMLKQSASSKHFFGNFGRESRPKLSQSRSYDNFKSQGVLGSEGSQLLCMNNDGKRAKYRVIHQQSQSEEAELYYCSKCTIPLVQQGFKVEEVTKYYQTCEPTQKITINREHINALQNKRRSCDLIINDITAKEEDELAEFDCYCSQVMAILQQQRAEMVGDYAKKKDPLIRLVNCIDSALDEMTDSYRRSSECNYDQILSEKEQNYTTDYLFCFKADDHIKNFKNFITKQHEQINSSSNIPQSSTNDNIQNRNHAMRFSFEKLLTSKGHNRTKMMPVMNPLEELDQEQQDEALKENHSAFRDLFPQHASEEMGKDIYSPTFKHI